MAIINSMGVRVLAGFIGALLGYWIAGLPGAILGFFILRMFGRGLASNMSPLGESREKVAQTFFNTTFVLLGRLAKADGRVSEEEIAHAEQLMVRMGISGDRRQQAIDDFKQGSSADFTLQQTLSEFNRIARFRPDLKQNLMAFLVEMAMVDGELDEAEAGVLKEVAAGLSFNLQHFEQMLEMLKAQHGFSQQGNAASRAQDIAAAYQALGVSADVSDRDLKKAYRKLMSQYHPDKMIAKGVPDDMLAMATEKAQEIQAAFEVVERARKAA